ncbi:hypothetical protein C4B68_16310 [Streptomyces dengpaensis]|uniref:Uncharacterized protein n=1 Tax=Streptomyces dengpaensis TaxID=2049881 RepID=A0ABN5IDH0_9ACTN|nr:hypothetical protein C4B68_16310 [Streptomyces dengpaensis]PIB09195.1 hypothetical protein B1C81_12200 [Streptomyces sp. HG99]
MRGRGSARGGQEGVLPRARTHYARTGPMSDTETGRSRISRRRPGQGRFNRRCSSTGMPLVTGRRQLTGSAKGQCSHSAH